MPATLRPPLLQPPCDDLAHVPREGRKIVRGVPVDFGGCRQGVQQPVPEPAALRLVVLEVRLPRGEAGEDVAEFGGEPQRPGGHRRWREQRR
jgi:hypothetical protein